MITKSGFNENYRLWLCSIIQDKVSLRMQKFTQAEVAAEKNKKNLVSKNVVVHLHLAPCVELK